MKSKLARRKNALVVGLLESDAGMLPTEKRPGELVIKGEINQTLEWKEPKYRAKQQRPSQSITINRHVIKP